MLGNDFELDLFQNVIRKLTFTPSIHLSDLILSGIELEIGREEFDKIYLKSDENSTYDLYSEKLNSRERYKRILLRLTLEDVEENSPAQLFTYPKRYSEFLRERQFILYNDMAAKIGFPSIKTVLPIHMMKEICAIDGLDINSEADDDNATNKAIHKYYPYFFVGDFKGVTLTEYILLLNIYQNTSNRSLFWLNKSFESDREVKSYEAWKSRIIANIVSPQNYKVYIDTFLRVFFETLRHDYNHIVKNSTIVMMVPTEYIVKRCACEDMEDGQFMADERDLYDLIEKSASPDVSAELEALEPLIYQVIPNVWKTLLLKYDSKMTGTRCGQFGYDDVDEHEKVKVARYCRLIEAYIDRSIKDVKTILNKFF